MREDTRQMQRIKMVEINYRYQRVARFKSAKSRPDDARPRSRLAQAVSTGACRKLFEYHLDLMIRPWIGPRLGRRWESPCKVVGQTFREFFELAGVQDFNDRHGNRASESRSRR